MTPRNETALGVNSTFDSAAVPGAVEVILEILLPGPNEFDRFPRSL